MTTSVFSSHGKGTTWLLLPCCCLPISMYQNTTEIKKQALQKTVSLEKNRKVDLFIVDLLIG
jgi:hypothetical protein